MQLISELRDKSQLYPIRDNIKTASMIGKNEQIIYERPPRTVAKLRDYYNTDLTVQNVINAFRDQIVGSSFYITYNKPKAVDIIDKFCNKLDFDNLLCDMIGEMLICSNSSIETLISDCLEHLSRVQIIRDEYGYTEASAIVIELVERRIGMQRRLKRLIENEIFDRVLLREGLDIKSVNVELQWGLAELPSFNVESFKVELCTSNKKDARNIPQRSRLTLDPNEVVE